MRPSFTKAAVSFRNFKGAYINTRDPTDLCITQFLDISTTATPYIQIFRCICAILCNEVSLDCIVEFLEFE